MTDAQLMQEALAAAEAAYRVTAQLARPALSRIERAGRSGVLVSRSEIASAQRLAEELHAAGERISRLQAAARQRGGQ